MVTSLSARIPVLWPPMISNLLKAQSAAGNAVEASPHCISTHERWTQAADKRLLRLLSSALLSPSFLPFQIFSLDCSLGDSGHSKAYDKVTGALVAIFLVALGIPPIFLGPYHVLVRARRNLVGVLALSTTASRRSAVFVQRPRVLSLTKALAAALIEQRFCRCERLHARTSFILSCPIICLPISRSPSFGSVGQRSSGTFTNGSGRTSAQPRRSC